MSHHSRLASVIVASLVTSACTSGSTDAPESTEDAVGRLGSGITSVQSFGDNPGQLRMYEHVPADLASGAPVVLVLHGCVQSAADNVPSGWNALADELKFLVVYPEQQISNDPMLCFNWAGEYGDPANLVRGEGENQSIKSMVDKALAMHDGDSKRVFVVGFSGGGSMAALLAATWPDVFAGAATMAGTPYNCTTLPLEVGLCSKGKDKTAADWGSRVRDAYPGYAGRWPRMSIWQGSADRIVGPMNGTQLMRQWTNVHGLSETPSASDAVDGHRHAVFNDGDGKTLVETFEIQGMGHGVPVRPSVGCGTTGSYRIDKGICGARHIAAFFGLTPVGQ